MIGYLATNDGVLDAPHNLRADSIMANTGNNVGNLAFWYVARRLLDEEVRFVTWSAKELPDDLTALVIPAANFIGPHADLAPLTKIVRMLDVPTIVVGLGAQAEKEGDTPEVNEACIEFLHEIASRAPYICVRGEYTARICAHFGVENVRVLGCPSVFLNGDKTLGERMEEAIGSLRAENVAVHAACDKGPLTSVERELVRMAQLRPGSSYVVQRPVEMMRRILREPLAEADLPYLKTLGAFFGFGQNLDDFIGFLTTTGYVPTSIDSWMTAMRKHSCSINTRIHGTMIPFQAGVPSICITHDTRTRELVQVMKLPTLETQEFVEGRYDVEGLFAAAQFDGKAFDAGRRELSAGYLELFDAVGLHASSHLSAFAN